MKNNNIIVSLTTWHKRIYNVPIVIDSILSQTIRPDKIVINLAYDEVIPADLNNYLVKHRIEINRVEDTKVYKKFLPTLLRYPNACVINIDDDFIYPPTMIEEFVELHNKYPNNPISGNRHVLYGMQCHCGCASLVKKEYFGDYLIEVDKDLMSSCLSSDLVFTYIATITGHPYIRTKSMYYVNLPSIESNVAYSSFDFKQVLNDTYNYLRGRFEVVPDALSALKKNRTIMHDWNQMPILYGIEEHYKGLGVKHVVIKSSTYYIWKFAFRVWCLIKPLAKRK